MHDIPTQPANNEERLSFGQQIKQATKDIGTGFKDGAVTAGKGIAGGFADAGRSIGSGIASAAKGVVSAAKGLRKPPETLSIMDLFNRKLYDFVDFDFVLNYLRSNNIAPCVDIYTIDELVEKIAPLTKTALRDRDAQKVVKAYSGIIRLCKRRRRGLLAYMSTEGHAIVCLITNWNTFYQYAGFNQNANLNGLIFKTVDVIPAWRAKKQIREAKASAGADVSSYDSVREQASAADTAASVAAYRNAIDQVDNVLPHTFSSVQATPSNETKVPEPKQYRMPNISGMTFPAISDNRQETFFFGEENNSLLNMARHYYDTAHDKDLRWDANSLSDTFLYFLLSRAYPDLEMLTTMEDYLAKVTKLFSSVNVRFDTEFLLQLTGSDMIELRTILNVPASPLNPDKHKMFMDTLVKISNLVLIAPYAPVTNQESDFIECYQKEIAVENGYREQALRELNGNELIILMRPDARMYPRVVRNYGDLVMEHNTKLFGEVYAGSITKCPNNPLEAICYLIHKTSGLKALQFEKYPRAFVEMLKAALPNYKINTFNGSDGKHMADSLLASQDTFFVYEFAKRADILSSLCAALNVHWLGNNDAVSARIDSILKEAVANVFRIDSAKADNFVSLCAIAYHAETGEEELSGIDTKSAAEVLKFDMDIL